jgi:hypothetical protein
MAKASHGQHIFLDIRLVLMRRFSIASVAFWMTLLTVTSQAGLNGLQQ